MAAPNMHRHPETRERQEVFNQNWTCIDAYHIISPRQSGSSTSNDSRCVLNFIIYVYYVWSVIETIAALIN
jgi:hypothetical protein